MYDETVRKELERLQGEYQRAYPDSEPPTDTLFRSAEQTIDLLREANGREILTYFHPNLLDAEFIRFRDPAETNPITLQELLYLRGLPRESFAKTKLIRHLDSKGDLDLHTDYQASKEKFLEYQRRQHRPVFRDCDYVVSSLGEPNSCARFLGVYKVRGVEKGPEGHYYYNLVEEAGFADLSERVIFKWVGAAVSWHQWLREKEPRIVIEVQRKGFDLPFRGYLDFVLPFATLKRLSDTQGPNDEWRRMLSEVAGVYLIRDMSTNNPTSGYQYIGAAYGEKGIWQRWQDYVKTNGHGGNAELRKLISADSNYARHFQFTILMTLSRSTTNDEVMHWEKLFKQKIGAQLCLN